MRSRVVGLYVMLLIAGCATAFTYESTSHEQSAPAAASPQKANPSTADQLDRLVAPVALYPDPLLAQMLLCAANPGRIGTLNEWLGSQGTLKGTALQDAAAKAGFDTSFVALVLFPDVVSFMAGQPEWTGQLGRAFAADRTAVFASIQRLRSRAQKAGTLKDTPQQDVATKTTSSGEQVIVIEPANPQVVYVPQYDPQVVYAAPSSTVVIKESSSSTSDAVAAGVIGFTAGIAIGAAMDNDYYYGPYGWGRGAYMYDDAWDDWYDEREDAREDWQDHREDLNEDRREQAGTQQQQRTDRQQTRQENRPESQAQREQRRTDASTSTSQAASTARTTPESRGYGGERPAAERSGTRSDAFSGYSSGKSQRAASERGQRSRSRSGGSGSRRR